LYAKPTAFFMTGTGNSYKVAKWFLEAIDPAAQAPYQVKENQAAISSLDSDLLLFCYPTHGFTAPWLMIKHIFRLPKGNKIHAVVLPTRAGTRIFGLTLPGMEGTAGYLIAILLLLRGYTVRGVGAVDMPSNWTAVHWGLNAENTRIITSNGEAKAKKISQEILAGNTFYTGFIPLILGVLLLRLSFIYLLFAQLILAKLFFASDRCNSCGLCRRICPKQAIGLIGNRPYWTYSCDSCMACMNFCPLKAIQVSSFSIFLFSYALSMPVAAWLTDQIGYHYSAGQAGMIGFAAQYAYTLMSVALLYLLLHYFLRLKPLASFLAGLSHTKYFRRYQAPGVSLQDIHK
jgi:ferredoxin